MPRRADDRGTEDKKVKSQGKSALLRKSKLILVILFTDDILRVMELIVS